jgi:hypothetical protein
MELRPVHQYVDSLSVLTGILKVYRKQEVSDDSCLALNKNDSALLRLMSLLNHLQKRNGTYSPEEQQD